MTTPENGTGDITPNVRAAIEVLSALPEKLRYQAIQLIPLAPNVRDAISEHIEVHFSKGGDKRLIVSKSNWRRHIAKTDPRAATVARRKDFYRLVLQVVWLEPEIRRAVMTALNFKARDQNNALNEEWARDVRWRIAMREREMRNAGEPLRGIPTRAFASIAQEVGMSVRTMRRRLQRIAARRRRRSP